MSGHYDDSLYFLGWLLGSALTNMKVLLVGAAITERTKGIYGGWTVSSMVNGQLRMDVRTWCMEEYGKGCE
jgi:hypothetical protein